MSFQTLCCQEGGPAGNGTGGPHPVGRVSPVEEKGLALRPGTRVPHCQLRPRGAVTLSMALPPQPPVKWVWGPDFLTLSPKNTITNGHLSGGGGGEVESGRSLPLLMFASPQAGKEMSPRAGSGNRQAKRKPRPRRRVPVGRRTLLSGGLRPPPPAFPVGGAGSRGAPRADLQVGPAALYLAAAPFPKGPRTLEEGTQLPAGTRGAGPASFGTTCLSAPRSFTPCDVFLCKGA